MMSNSLFAVERSRSAVVASFLLCLLFGTCLLVGCRAKREAETSQVGELSSGEKGTASPDAATGGSAGNKTVVDLRSVPGGQLVEAVAEVSANEQAEEVILTGEAVDDELVAPLLELPNLKRLKLEKTSVGDATVRELAKNNRLELLYLIDASGLTAEGVESLGKMTRLRNLRVSGPAVTDRSVSSLSKLTNLAALTLQESDVSDEGFVAIENLEKLKELSLFGTPVTDRALVSIAKLPNLAKLRLRATEVTGNDAEPLASMPVVDLELAETDFSNSGMPNVAQMPKLEKLNLWLTEVDDEGLTHLQDRTQLTLLNLDNVSGITNDSLGAISSLPNLTLLHLGGTSITEEGLPKLYGLDQLETLFITRLGVSKSAVKKLREELPSLERLEY